MKAGPKYFERHSLFFAKQIEILVNAFFIAHSQLGLYVDICTVFSVNKYDFLTSAVL